jgi:hypothetical protein
LWGDQIFKFQFLEFDSKEQCKLPTDQLVHTLRTTERVCIMPSFSAALRVSLASGVQSKRKQKKKSEHRQSASDQLRLSFKNINQLDFDAVQTDELMRYELLDLSNNCITELSAFMTSGKHITLQQLLLHNNDIADVAQLRFLARSRLASLEVLTLYNNPIELHPGYRGHVIRMFPNLKLLDELIVSDRERTWLQIGSWCEQHLLPFVFAQAQLNLLLNTHVQFCMLRQELYQEHCYGAHGAFRRLVSPPLADAALIDALRQQPSLLLPLLHEHEGDEAGAGDGCEGLLKQIFHMVKHSVGVYDVSSRRLEFPQDYYCLPGASYALDRDMPEFKYRTYNAFQNRIRAAFAQAVAEADGRGGVELKWDVGTMLETERMVVYPLNQTFLRVVLDTLCVQRQELEELYAARNTLLQRTSGWIQAQPRPSPYSIRAFSSSSLSSSSRLASSSSSSSSSPSVQAKVNSQLHRELREWKQRCAELEHDALQTHTETEMLKSHVASQQEAVAELQRQQEFEGEREDSETLHRLRLDNETLMDEIADLRGKLKIQKVEMSVRLEEQEASFRHNMGILAEEYRERLDGSDQADASQQHTQQRVLVLNLKSERASLFEKCAQLTSRNEMLTHKLGHARGMMQSMSRRGAAPQGQPVREVEFQREQPEEKLLEEATQSVVAVALEEGKSGAVESQRSLDFSTDTQEEEEEEERAKESPGENKSEAVEAADLQLDKLSEIVGMYQERRSTRETSAEATRLMLRSSPRRRKKAVMSFTIGGTGDENEDEAESSRIFREHVSFIHDLDLTTGIVTQSKKPKSKRGAVSSRLYTKRSKGGRLNRTVGARAARSAAARKPDLSSLSMLLKPARGRTTSARRTKPAAAKKKSKSGVVAKVPKWRRRH